MPLTSELAAGLRGRRRRIIRRSRRAAVLVPIVEDGGPERLILTRRAETLPTHRGQVAFPGGLIEAGDGGPEETALREAEEEIGLSRGAVEIVGLLDDFTTWDDRISVTSVAGRIRRVPALKRRREEVARIFEIGLADLARPERWTWEPDPVRADVHRLYFFEHDGETLWGLSARIVIHLLELAGLPSPRADGGPPPR